MATMRAIDLYSGMGGWTLGFETAGIEVVESYEWWPPANITNSRNNNGRTLEKNIRELNPKDIAKNIDIVIGSPPCTQFSYANRGGAGDIEDGLKDIHKFLEIVDYIRPKYWIMENVPRVQKVLIEQSAKGMALERFSHLISKAHIEVFNLSEFGVPQKRKRCIAGNFDVTLLLKYKSIVRKLTLGDVLDALHSAHVTDPIYGIELSNNELTEMEKEDALSWEEERYNKEVKTNHPVYNNMAFPEHLDKPVRTITATCTRVSRESVVIEDHLEPNNYRRLSVRERGMLQGFPMDYQFYGSSHSQKLKMIGNAVPPVFTYLLAETCKKTKPSKLKKLSDVYLPRTVDHDNIIFTKPDTASKNYKADRSFRFAISSLRFKSGMRFELNNLSNQKWSVHFFYGDSKRIQEFDLNLINYKKLKSSLSEENSILLDNLRLEVQKSLKDKLLNISSSKLQKRWVRCEKESLHPFVLLDELAELADEYIEDYKAKIDVQNLSSTIASILSPIDPNNGKKLFQNKLEKYCIEIFVGIPLGLEFNKAIN